MHLMKVIHRAPVVLMASTLTATVSLVCSASMSTLVSESKEEELDSSIIAESQNVPCYDEVVPASLEFPTITLDISDEDDEGYNITLDFQTNESVIQENIDTSNEETQDIIGTNLEDEDDPDPLSYLSEIEYPEPDWTIIPKLDPSLLKQIVEQSWNNDVDPAVVIALIESESGFYTDVTSCAGCYGLMQLHPLYYPEDMYDPYKNIQYGCETIGRNLQKYNGYIEALSVYANGHVGTDFTYQYDVMERAKGWRQKLIDANIL